MPQSETGPLSDDRLDAGSSPAGEKAALLRQQISLANFGALALRSENLDEILREACRIVGQALGTDLTKVLELQPNGNQLLIRAGVGWKPGVVGKTTLPVDEGSPGGHALRTGRPVISANLRHETRFAISPVLRDNGAQALIAVVIIGGKDQPPFGVLQVNDRTPRRFNDDDVVFLRAHANLLAAAVDRLRVLDERRKAEALLRASSEVLYSLGADGSEMRQLKGGGFLADTATVSPDWLRDYVPADEQPRVSAALRHANATKTLFQLEHRVRLPNGEIGWVASRAVPLLDTHGTIVEWFGAATDVTARRQVEIALAKSNRWLQQAQEAGKVGFFSVNFFEGVLYPTPEFCRLFGVPVCDSIPVQEIQALVHREDAASAYINLARMAEKVPTEAVYRINRGDTGELRWIARKAEFEYDEHGRLISFSGIARDITAEREQSITLARLNYDLEQRVEERTRELDCIWRLSRDMLGVATADGVWISVNPAWTEILGWSEPELVGQTLRWLIHPDDLDEARNTRRRLATGEPVLGFENRLRTRDGVYRVIHWTAIPSEGFAYSVGRDVTDERAQAAALAQVEEALRQSQKMEAVGQLTGGLAHDFNNLLTGVTGSLELLQTRIAQGRINEVDRYIDAAQAAARRAAALTHRLLAFSRRQTLDPKPTDVGRLVAGMGDLIGRTVGPAISFELRPAEDGLWSTLVDSGQLENALLNLCINARDAMPEGGKLNIEVANRRLDERAARQRDLVAGDYVALAVSDTGIGMSPEIIAKAFEPFFTTKPIGHGTGLGLSMIYGFAKQSGGQVRIHSQPDQGTTVTIILPRHLGAAEAAPKPADLTEAPRATAGQTVLVVDDEPTIRMLVIEVLEDLGYRALEAADGPAGLHILLSDIRIDLLVTDVGLPRGMNGRQMADAARVFRPDLRILFITGYAEKAILRDGQLDPGMSVLTKPFTMQTLASRIKQLIDAASPSRDQLSRP